MASLLHAAECCILLIDPRRRHIDKFDQATQQTLVRRFGAIERAALLARPPMHDLLDLLGQRQPLVAIGQRLFPINRGQEHAQIRVGAAGGSGHIVLQREMQALFDLDYAFFQVTPTCQGHSQRVERLRDNLRCVQPLSQG